jgi:hypothetical protein
MRSVTRVVGPVILCSSIGLLLCSCASTKDLLKIKDLKKVAIVQIASNKTVAWADTVARATTSQNQSNAEFMASAAKSAGLTLEAPNAEHSAEKARDASVDAVFQALAAAGILQVMAKEDVLGNAQYTALVNDRFHPELLPAAGFKVPAMDDAVKNAELCKNLNADALLIVSITFKKNMWNGMGKTGPAKAAADVYIRLFDVNGKVIWWRTNTASSESTTPMNEGTYNYTDMDQLCVEAVQSSTAKMMADLKKALDAAQAQK